MKALFIDFKDSFTYNLLSFLSPLGLDLKVLSFDKLNFNDIKNYELLILGPGPGYPEFYKMDELLKNALSENQKILGVCLGHQIICHHLGYKVLPKKNLHHGHTEKVTLDRVEYSVQSYNSLAVKSTVNINNISRESIEVFNKDDELVSLQSKKLLTYQFHPESIGTSQKALLLSSVGDFIYNKQDGSSTNSY